ncbi:type III pantothenate kinase [bacterium]|nr:type III pantothenate kinase [bacterium]
MILALDVGNTTILMGLYNGRDLIGDWRFSTMREKTGDEIGCMVLSALQTRNIGPDDINGAVVSCVVPSLIDRIKRMCRIYLGCDPLEIDPSKKGYIPLAYPDPAQIGADRIVNAVAAHEKYGAPLIIIDFGTATTFCAISSKGEFMGGCIVPGIGISQEALVAHAERLLPVSWERPGSVIARNTDDAIRAGLLFGYASLVDGIVVRMKREMRENPKVIATGGWASVIKEEAGHIDIMDPFLTLDGLRIIYERETSCT